MSLLFDFRPIVINPKLAQKIGLNEAIILQQIKYWIMETNAGVQHDGLKWIYNTHQAWVEQFPFWSEDTIKRGLLSLKAKGAIRIEQLNKSKHDRTNYYTIIFESDCLIDQGNLPLSTSADSADLHTENTAESTKTIRQQAADPINYDKIFDSYEKHLPMLPKPRLRTDARKRAIKSAMGLHKKMRQEEWWDDFFALVADSDFLTGKTGWKNCCFDWLMNKANLSKVIDGNYNHA